MRVAYMPCMTLDQFLNLPWAPTSTEFGLMCDPQLSEASISRIRHGLQNIRLTTLRSIIVASAGVVTPDGLVGQVLS